LCHLTSKPYPQKGKAIVKDVIFSATIFLGTISVDQYTKLEAKLINKAWNDSRLNGIAPTVVNFEMIPI